MIAAGLLAVLAPLADLRVGQDEATARIEVVCGGPCAGRLDADGVILTGVDGTVSAPVPDGPVTRIDVSERGGTTRLTYTASATVVRAELAACGDERVCLDLRFAPSDLRAALAAASGDALDAATCEAANRTLAADAYDLTAFRQVALCRAAGGRLREGAGLLDRLLAYRDDPAATRARAVLVRRLEAEEAPG